MAFAVDRAAQLLLEYGEDSIYWSYDETVAKLKERFGQHNVREKFVQE